MRARRLLSGLLVIALCTSACGGGDDDGAEGDATGTTDASSGIPAEIERHGQQADPEATFRFATSGSIDSLDPLFFDAVFGEWIPAYDSLFRPSPDDPSEVEGALAEDWSYSADGKELDVTLRKGVTFHDGELLTADAVKSSLDRVLADPVVVAQNNLTIQNVEVLDEYKVRIHLTQPNLGLHKLMVPRARWAAIVSPRALADPAALATTEAGTGPFRMVRFERGVKVVFERYDAYWDQEHAAGVKTLEISYLPDPQTQLNAVQTGQVDGAMIPASLIDAAQQSGLRLAAASARTVFTMSPNRTRSEFDDVRVRQAVSYALDREALCDAIWFGACTPTSQPFEEGSPSFVSDLGADHYAYDPEKAASLLAEAGLADGFTFGLTYINADVNPQLAEAVQGQLAEVGITVDLEPVEPAQLAEVYLQRDAIFGGTPSAGDPALTLQGFYSPTGPGNLSKSVPPELESLVNQIIAESDATARAKEMEDAGRIIVEEALDFPIVFPDHVFAFSDKVIEFSATRALAYDPGFQYLFMTSG